MSTIEQNIPTNNSIATIGGQCLVASFVSVTAGNVIFMCAYDLNGVGLIVSDDDSNTWYTDYNSNNIYDKNFWGIFMFSRIMFDHTGKEALIEVRSTTKENNDNDKLIHLKKNENNEWTIVGRDILVPENSNYYEKYP